MVSRLLRMLVGYCTTAGLRIYEVLGMLAAGNECQGDAGGCLMNRCLGLDAGVWLGRFGYSRQLLLQWSLVSPAI